MSSGGPKSDSGDYEARRILEKFVDAYEDLSEQLSLGSLVQSLWKAGFKECPPWILAADETNANLTIRLTSFEMATGYDVMTTAISFYSNLRVLTKAYAYVRERAGFNRHLLWTIWHLEIVTLAPRANTFRQRIVC